MQNTADTTERAERAIATQNEGSTYSRMVLHKAQDNLALVITEEQNQDDTWAPTVATLYEVDKHSGQRGTIGRQIATLIKKDCDPETFGVFAAALLEIATR